MRANIVRIGNSKGVRIPKTLLEQLQIEQSVEFEILPEGLLLRPVHEQPKSERPARAGWDEMFRASTAESGDAAEEFSDWNQNYLSEFDEKEW